MSQVNREFLFFSILKKKGNYFSSSKLTKLSSDKKKMSLCQKQRQQIIISITHTSTFNVKNKDIYIYIRKKNEENLFFLPDMVHNEARSLLVLSSTMPDEYIYVCVRWSIRHYNDSHSLFLPLLSLSLDSRAFNLDEWIFFKNENGKEWTMCVCVRLILSRSFACIRKAINI